MRRPVRSALVTAPLALALLLTAPAVTGGLPLR